jgi:hypothetical protein
MPSSTDYTLTISREEQADDEVYSLNDATYCPDPSEQEMIDGFELEDSTSLDGDIVAFGADGDESEQIQGSVKEVSITMDSGTQHEGWVTTPTYLALQAAVGQSSGIIKFKLYKTDPTQGTAKFSNFTMRKNAIESVEEIQV